MIFSLISCTTFEVEFRTYHEEMYSVRTATAYTLDMQEILPLTMRMGVRIQ